MIRRKLPNLVLLSLGLTLGTVTYTLPVNAQNAEKNINAKAGKIKGKVIYTNGHGAADLTISLKNTSIGAITEADGSFLIKAAPGNYTLVVSGIGIETKEQSITVKTGEATEVGVVKIAASANELNEAVIRTNKSRYKITEPSNGLRLQETLIETPQNIQVVTAKVIADQQIFDMLEGVTRNVSGATMLEHWGTYALINMRGSQIAAFRNGMNVQMPWGPLTEDMSFVDRIEFVKGPAGFMMANGEPSGFYNVVTKKPTGVEKGEVNFTMGSYDTYRSTIDLDGKLSKDGKLLYRLDLMGQLKGSFRPYDYNNRYTVAPVITYKFNDKTSLTAEYTYQYSKMAMIGSAYVFSPKGFGDLPQNFTTGEANLDPTKINDHSFFLTLNHQLSDNWKLTAQGAYFNFKQIGSSMWPSSIDSSGNLYRRVGIWDAAGQNKLAQVFVNGEVKTGPITHHILVGLDMGTKEYLADWGQGYTLNGTDGPFNVYHPVYGKVPVDSIPTFDRSKSLRERASTGGEIETDSYTGLYAQDELRFFEDRVRFTLAGRYTNVIQQSTAYGSDTRLEVNKFTPRVGLSVSIDRQTSIYGLYDQAFVPQTGVDYYGKKFDPITGNNIEAGIKRDWFNGRWNTTVSAYQITKNNVLTTDPEHANFSTQLGQTQIKGVEVDIRGEIVRGLSLILNYAYTDSKITKDTDPKNVGTPVPGFAKHLTNGWLTYRFAQGALKGIGLSLGYQYQVDRSTWSWGADNNPLLPDYFRMDGSISWQNNKFSIGVNVNNILNKYLYSGAAYATYYYWQSEPPRNFRLNIGYRF